MLIIAFAGLKRSGIGDGSKYRIEAFPRVKYMAIDGLEN